MLLIQFLEKKIKCLVHTFASIGTHLEIFGIEFLLDFLDARHDLCEVFVDFLLGAKLF